MLEQAKVLSGSVQRRARRLLLAFLLATVLLAIPFFALAHPLGNFSVNCYSRIELASQHIALFYVLDMAEIPTFQEFASIDRDEDGTISETEHEQYLASRLASLQSNLHLEVDGTPLRLQVDEQSLAFPAGQGGLQTMRLEARFLAELPASGGTRRVTFRDENYAERLGWQEIVLRSADGIEILQSSVPTEDISQELRAYPDELLQSPLKVSEATFSFQLGGVSSGSTMASQSVLPVIGVSTDKFAELITTRFPRSSGQAFGVGTFILALMAAFGFGAAHALTPGHGKTIVAAYLVGSRGTMRHAIFLGLTTTMTHTAGVFALGFITLFLSQYILPEQLYPWLGLFSGLLVVGIGFSIFGQRLREFINPNLGHHHHHHHDYDDAHHAHHHHDETHHAHHHDSSHHHSHLPPGTDGELITWRRLLALGISGGILPCPSALVVLLSAIALQRVGIGLLLIVAFSVGLASVLTGIGILMVYAGRLFERIPVGGRVIKALPVASAFIITIVGIGLTLQALAQTGILQTITVASSGLF